MTKERGEPNTLIIEDANIASGFTQIPNWLLRSREVTRDAKLLYGVLLSYAWQTERCFPGYETLMDDLCCAREALAKYIKELKDKGLIKVQRRGQGKTSIYTITKGMAEKFGNRTSRSSRIEPPEVRESKHEEYPVEKYSEEQETDLSNFRMANKTEQTSSRHRKTATDAETNISHDFKKIGAILPDSTPPRQVEPEPYYEDRQVLLEYIQDLAAEFNDQASLKSSTTRAYNLFKRSGLSLNDFLSRLYEARATTKERTSMIRSATKEGNRAFPTKQKMAYFFACLEERLGLRQSGLADSRGQASNSGRGGDEDLLATEIGRKTGKKGLKKTQVSEDYPPP